MEAINVSDNIVIKPYYEDDINEVVGSVFPFGREYLHRSIFQRSMKWVKHRNDIHIVAFDQNSFAGYVFIRQITEATWGMWNAFVATSYRGRGLSKKLYQACLDEVRNQGGKYVIAQASPNNPPGFKGMQTMFTYLTPTIQYACVDKAFFGRLYGPVEDDQSGIRVSRPSDKIFLDHIRNLFGSDWFRILDYDSGFRNDPLEPEPRAAAQLLLRRRYLWTLHDSTFGGFAIYSHYRGSKGATIDFYPPLGDENRLGFLETILSSPWVKHNRYTFLRLFGVNQVEAGSLLSSVNWIPHRVCYAESKRN